MTSLSSRKFSTALFIVFILAGIFCRFYRITENTFVFYDEGMWLAQGKFLQQILAHSPHVPFTALVKQIFKMSLHTGKALWAFIANLRVLFMASDGYAFTRVVSAVSGTLTLGILYLFASKHLQSGFYALMCVALLAVLPTHIFYSRVGLQEALSAFLFLCGLYCYVYRRHILLRAFLSGTLWAAVYFSNYRLIVLPVAVFIVELCLDQKFDVRRFVYSLLTFFSWIFGLGSLYKGANIYVTFGWMFHQSDLAAGVFNMVDLISFPYYLVHFESIWFAGLLFAGGFFVYKKDYARAYPFLLFVVFAFGFSLSQEKGVRYLAFLYPVFVVGVVSVIQYFSEKASFSQKKIWLVILILLFGQHLYESYKILGFHSDYAQSIADVRAKDPGARFVSSQAVVQKLFVPDSRAVLELRKGLPFLVQAYRNGYRYLIIDPQAYVSLTASGKRFVPVLDGYLQFVRAAMPPILTYNHFSHGLLERFVWEHNEHFKNSYKFLKEDKENQFHQLRVYDTGRVLLAVRKILEEHER